ncbi:PP2C family protein-serine/threonine phosphatase [Streptomyces olivaceoviridis]|uniref:PP2C family protein-serine/threonine phosphatase n=1 Tax=Streptomyces olivaceoviridis TaxID=1921 RepID=UPI00368FBEB9
MQDTPYGVRCLIGDVRGKGMGAVEAVTVVLGAFREGAQREPTLTGVAEWIEQTLLREAAQRKGLDQVEDFTTALLAEIPRPGDQVRLVNRGHPAPLLLLEGAVRPLEPSRPALPLGLAPLDAGTSPVDTVAFPQGATLLLYTDGVTEARDRRGTFFDPVDRLTGQCPHSPDELLAAVVADVHRHTRDHITDDMALLALTHTTRGPGLSAVQHLCELAAIPNECLPWWPASPRPRDDLTFRPAWTQSQYEARSPRRRMSRVAQWKEPPKGA